MHPLPASDRPGTFGPQSLDELPQVLHDLGFSRVLLLTGKASFTGSGADRVLPALEQVATVKTWSDFSPNPAIEDLLAGSEVLRDFRPDAVVAIGGGSVLDMAKLVATLGPLPSAEIVPAVRGNTVPGRSIGLVLVPTTSGSGSEATHFAVAYIGATKYSVTDPCLLPDYVVLDPELTRSASEYQKATSVIDAIAQAVESRWARGATPESRAFAEAALADLCPAAPDFLADDPDATGRAARGSHLAGRAIDISKTTGAHALAYYLTQQHGVSHGHAVATTLGAFARAHARQAGSEGADPGLEGTLERIAELTAADSATALGDRLDDIARGLGLQLRLRDLGVDRAELGDMARTVNQERLGNNPVSLTPDELEQLLESCW